MITSTVTQLPAPLAEDAAVATRQAGECALCHHTIIVNERFALLVPSGKAAHLRCIAVTAAAPRRVPSIW